MFKAALVVPAMLAAGFGLRAETHKLTMQQAVELALKQNPDIVLARLDEQRMHEGIRIARDPFTLRIGAGSGLAYSDGFPMAIAGQPPSVFQAQATMSIFDRQKSMQLAQAKEQARGASFVTANKRDEAAYRAATLYLDAERAERMSDVARRDIESRTRMSDAVKAQVQEGRALPLTQKQAELAVAQARQAALDWEDQRDSAETQLAIALGYPAEDRVQASEEERRAPELPATTEEAVQAALASNNELRQLQSQMAAKRLEIRGDKSARLPRVDLVAQYALLAKFNNYAQFYNTFQRNNGQIGASFQVPIFAGSGVGGQVAQAEIDVTHLRNEMTNVRNRITADLQQSYRDVGKAQSAAEVARLDLDVAREQISVDLAQMQEGRLAMSVLEQARVAENAKWIALYDAQYALEKARWSVLRWTGQLTAAVVR
ncbi:MAG TPA: TolC family protein [Bryobacteraceae bacterium]|nr:TolC family protein [Bryobacteraceae bacterium]